MLVSRLLSPSTWSQEKTLLSNIASVSWRMSIIKCQKFVVEHAFDQVCRCLSSACRRTGQHMNTKHDRNTRIKTQLYVFHQRSPFIMTTGREVPRLKKKKKIILFFPWLGTMESFIENFICVRVKFNQLCSGSRLHKNIIFLSSISKLNLSSNEILSVSTVLNCKNDSVLTSGHHL